MSSIRDQLVQLALKWQHEFGVAPPITSTVSEYDAALLLGMPEKDYSAFMQTQTAVQKGFDFIYQGVRYQIKANRPSGKAGSFVTMVPKAKNYDWDVLIWILYTKEYEIAEAWAWEVDDYREAFDGIERLSPNHYRKGRNLLNPHKAEPALVRLRENDNRYNTLFLIARFGLKGTSTKGLLESWMWSLQALDYDMKYVSFHKTKADRAYKGGKIVGFRKPTLMEYESHQKEMLARAQGQMSPIEGKTIIQWKPILSWKELWPQAAKSNPMAYRGYGTVSRRDTP